VLSALSSAKTTFDGNRTIANYNALNTAMTNANACVTAYAGAKAFFDEVDEVLANTNVYTAAAYATYYTEPKAKYEDNTLTTEEANALVKTSTGNRVANTLDDILLSTWTIGGEQAKDYTKGLYINTWSTEGNSDGSEFRTPFFEYWVWDTNSLGATTLTSTITGLTANATYSFTIRARARNTNNQTIVPEKIMMKVGEGTAVDISAGAHFGSTQFYIGNFSAVGQADAEGKLVTTITVSEGSNVSWLSFYNCKYTEGEDLSAYIADYEFAKGNVNTALTTDVAYTAMQTDLQAAATTYATVDNTDKAALIAAKEALETALATYNAVVGPLKGNDLSKWTTTGNNGQFHVNSWSGEGASDGSHMITPFTENWVGSGTSLTDATMSYTVEGLTPGYYKVTALIRSLNEAGGATPAGSFIFANDAIERAYDTNSLPCTNGVYGNPVVYGLVGEDGKLTIGVKIIKANVNWVSWKNFVYTYEGTTLTQAIADNLIEEARTFENAGADAAVAQANAISALSTLSNANYTAAGQAIEAAYKGIDRDFTALATAIAEKAGYTLGFETGEYAPYSGIESAYSNATAIDQTSEANTQDEINTAATNLANATANTGEVNAIYNGDFAIAAHDGASNAQPTGWYRNDETYTGDGYNVRYVTIPSGVEGNTSAKGLFGKFTMKYGAETGYTLPLKQGYYKLTFSYGGWAEVGTREVQLYNDDNNATVEIGTVTAADNKANNTASSWRAYSSFIDVPADGNYILSFYRENTISQNQIVLTDIVLVKATVADFKVALLAEITSASAVDVTTNVGYGVFQKPAAAATALTTAISDAQAVYDNAAATISEVLSATESVKTAVETYNNVELNAPDATKRYAVTMHDAGKDWDGNAITFIAGGRSGEGNYNVKYEAPANVNLAQALKFTSVAGKSNTFYVSVVNANGDEQYLTSKTLAYGDGTVNDQIRTIDDEKKAVEISVKVADGVDGFKLFNQTGTEIARNSSSPDNGLFPNGNVDSYFTIAETTKPSITINTTAAGYGTTILPFAQDLPTDVKAYSCAAVDGNTLTLVEVDGLEANKPYLIEGAWNETVTGDALGTALTNTVGLFTGVYAAQTAPVGSFVLQKNNDKVGFYKVQDGEGNQPTVNANRIYMTVPAGARFDAFFFDSETTGINAINALTSGEAEIYNLKGEKIDRLQKGMNIIKMNGKIQKVMVK
jgi:hypothetical protein